MVNVRASEHVAGTIDHKQSVGEYLTKSVEIILSASQRKDTNGFVLDLMHRAVVHDNSKFGNEEFEGFERATPRLKSLTYGTPEWQENMDDLRETLVIHYRNNSHHPEFYEGGITSMSVLDQIEMVCDWLAAASRSKGGFNLAVNVKRFNISEEHAALLQHTVDHIVTGEHTGKDLFDLI